MDDSFNLPLTIGFEESKVVTLAMTSNKPNDDRLKIIPKQNRLIKPYDTKLPRKSRPPDIHKENYSVLKPCCVKLKKIVTENTNSKSQPISSSLNKSSADNAVISIPPYAMSYEDFRKFTNIETLVRDDIKRRLQNAEPYLKNIGNYIRKYYDKHFVALSKWPKKLKLCPEYSLTLDNVDSVNGLNNNVPTVDKDIQHASPETDSSISRSPETQSLAAHFPDTNSVIECRETRTEHSIDPVIPVIDPVSKEIPTIVADRNGVCIKQENNTDVTNADLEILCAISMQLKTEPDCPLPSSQEHLSVGGQSCSEESSQSRRLSSTQNQPIAAEPAVSDEHSMSEENPVSNEGSAIEKNSSSKEPPLPEQNIPSDELRREKIDQCRVEPSPSETRSSSLERHIYPETILKYEEDIKFEEPDQTESDIENNANNHNTIVPTTNATNSDNWISSDHLCKSEPFEEPPEFLPSQNQQIIINDKEPTVENLFDEMINNPEPLQNVELPIEASTTKDRETEGILGKHRKSVLNSESKSADKEKTIEEPIELGPSVNLSRELFPPRNETKNTENTATSTSQKNEVFVPCDIHNISNVPNAMSQNCELLSLGTTDLVNTDSNLSRMNVSGFIPLNNLMRNKRKRKSATKDENNFSDSDNSTATEIFPYRPTKRKVNAIWLHLSDITINTTPIKVKQEEEYSSNDPLPVVTDSDLQVSRTIVESMKSEVTDEEITAETNKFLAVGMIHDSPSDISEGQCCSNASSDYVQPEKAIAGKVKEKDVVQTKSDSVVTIERNVTTQERESNINPLTPESTKSSPPIVIDICPKDITVSDFLKYTNVKEFVRKEIVPKFDLSEEQIEEVVANVYEKRLLKLEKWPEHIAFIDGTIRTLDDFKRFKMEIKKKKTATETKLSKPTHGHLAIDVPSTSRNTTKTQSQLPDSTHIARSEQAVSNTSPKKAVYSSKSETGRIRILPKDISLEDFKQLTNIEHLIRSDLFHNYQDKSASYIKGIDKLIRKYYERHFIKLSVWPSKILFKDSSIHTLEDIQHLKCQKLEGLKEQIELPIEASTAKDLEKQIISGKRRKSVLNSKSKFKRNMTAGKQNSIKEKHGMKANLNLSPELFPAINETESGENNATLRSQLNEALISSNSDNISKERNTTPVGSQTFKLARAKFPDSTSLNNLSGPGQCETIIPDKTNIFTILPKYPIKDEKDTLDDLGTSNGEIIVPVKQLENNSYDSDNSTTTEIFPYRPVKRKANAILLHSFDSTLDTPSIKVKQEEGNASNESLDVLTESDLQIVRALVESMKSEVTDEEITPETNKFLAVGIIHDSPSNVSGGQGRSNSSPDYVQLDEAIAEQVIEEDVVQTKSDSLAIIERDASTRSRKSDNDSENILAPESTKRMKKHIKKLISPLVENKAAVKSNTLKRSVEEITPKSNSLPASRNSDSRSSTQLDTTENQSEICTNIPSIAASVLININKQSPIVNNIKNVNFEQSKDRKSKAKEIVFKIPQIICRYGKKSEEECKKAVIERLNSHKITPMENLDTSSFEISTNVLRISPVAESSSSQCAKKPEKLNKSDGLQEIIVSQAKHSFQPLPLVSKFKNGNSISNETAKRKATGQPCIQHKKRKLSSMDQDYLIKDSGQASHNLFEITIEKDENEPKVHASSRSFEMANTKSRTVALNVINWEYLEEVAKFNNHIMKPCFKDLKSHLSHMTTITLGSIPNSLVSSIHYTSTYALLNFPAKLRFQSKTVLVRDDSYIFDIFQSSLRFAVSINASKEKDLLEFLAAIKSSDPLSYCSSPVQAASICALQAILSRFKYFTVINIQKTVRCHDFSFITSRSVIPNSKSFNSAGITLMYKTFKLLNNQKND